MIEVKYTCDRCGRSEVGDREFIDLVSAGVLGSNYAGGVRIFDHTSRSAEWCKDCQVQTGIRRPDRESTIEVQDPPLTLEDLVREIARDEVCNG